MRKLLISALISATLLFAGCSVHKLEIQQGNIITPEMLEKLEPGMTMRQVRFVLGTPQLTDPFHENRWDYLYTLRENNTETEHKHLVLHFEGDVLKEIVHQR